MKTSIKFRTVLLLTAAIVFSLRGFSQNTWMNFTNGDVITDVAGSGNILWIATTGGLMKYDKTTQQKFFYNKANSGLPRNEITALAVEPLGNLWLITDAGLSEFDGSNWTFYDTANSNLPNPFLRDIAVDQSGDKWITTAYGLILYDGTTWSIYDTSNSNISTEYTSRIFISPSGDKWISSMNGLEQFDGTNWYLYDFGDAPWLYNTSDMAFKNNIAYIATHGDFSQGAGVIIFDGTAWSDFTPSNSGLPFDGVECLSFDTAGNLWIGNHASFGGSYALVKYDGTNWTADSSASAGLLYHIFVDQNNRIFTGSSDRGLNEFSGTAFTKINTSNSGLTANGGSELFIDNQQDVWTINYLGFAHFDRQTWTVFDTTNSSFLNSGVFSIARDHSGNSWIATNEGLVKHDGTAWTRFDTSNSGLTDQYINAVNVDADNAVWAGTNSGPFKFDGTTWTNYFNPAGSHIQDIFTTNDGDVWMGSPGYGLSRFDRISTWTNYVPVGGSGYQAGALDKNGNVWFGGNNLHKWDGTTWTMYTTAEGLPWPYVLSLAVDTNNILWIGTQLGLSKYDGTTFTNYFRENSGLTDNYISDIEVDAFNNKWIATSNGISVFNENGVVMSAKNLPVKSAQVNFYPNPTQGMLCVNVKDFSSQQMLLTINDVLGKELNTFIMNSGVNKVDISSLPAGVYSGTLTADGLRFSEKFVVW